jgi:hypothetical protein
MLLLGITLHFTVSGYSFVIVNFLLQTKQSCSTVLGLALHEQSGFKKQEYFWRDQSLKNYIFGVIPKLWDLPGNWLWIQSKRR